MALELIGSELPFVPDLYKICPFSYSNWKLADSQHFGFPFGHRKKPESYKNSISNAPIDRQPPKHTSSLLRGIFKAPSISGRSSSHHSLIRRKSLAGSQKITRKEKQQLHQDAKLQSRRVEPLSSGSRRHRQSSLDRNDAEKEEEEGAEDQRHGGVMIRFHRRSPPSSTLHRATSASDVDAYHSSENLVHHDPAVTSSSVSKRTPTHDCDLTLARDATIPPPPDAASQIDQTPNGPPAINSTLEESKRAKDTVDTALKMIETAEDAFVSSEGVSANQETVSATAQPVVDEAQIAKLKRYAQRLEAAIRNIESRKSELSDWFLDQMLVVRNAGGDGLLRGGSALPSEAEIKRSYKRRNAELKQRLSELEVRLTDTRLTISQLEEGAKRAAAEEKSKTKSTPSMKSARLPAAKRRAAQTGQSAAGNEDTDASISLTNVTPSNKPGDELRATMTDSSHQKPSSSPSHHRHRATNKSKVDDNEEQEEQDHLPDRLSQHPSPSKLQMNSKTDDLHFAKTQTLPALQPYPPYQNLVVPVPGSSTSRVIRPSGSSGDSERPDRGSLEQFSSPYFINHADASTPPKPQSAKKSRISAGKALKHGFSIFTKPFGRRSDIVTSSSPLKMTKSISDEHVPATGYGNLADASNLPTIPPGWSFSSPTGVVTSSKSKKSNKQGNGISDYLESSRKKSHTGSVSSRPSTKQVQQTPRRDSAATSGAGSEAPASSSSPHAPLQTNSGHANPSACTGVNVMPLASIIDTLYGINVSTVASAQGVGGLATLPRGSTVAGNNLANYSCGGSTNSGGDARGSLNGGGGVGNPAGGGQLQQQQQGIIGGPPLPVYNVAMALALMCQRIQALVDAQAEAQQKASAEIKEELSSLRSELTETRNLVNTLTVEVDALRRDMQTKEEVANQKLGDTVAKLEQLDASAEKLRQNVQQDLITIRNEQKHALEPLKYQLATETRDLRDMFTTLSNKVTILEKCERLSNLDRDQPKMLRSIANTLTDFLVSLVAFLTTLIQMLIRFLNAGATVTNNRMSAIVLNVCLLIFLLLLFLSDSIARWWNRSDGVSLNQNPPPSSLPPR